MLGTLDGELSPGPRALVELHAFAAIALYLALDPQEHLGPYRLRARIAAPQSTRQSGKEEQAQSGDDEQCGEIEEILGEQREPEYVEAPCREVENHQLLSFPVQPRHAIEQPQQHHDGKDPHGRENAVNFPRVDLLPLRVQGLIDALVERFSRGLGTHRAVRPLDCRRPHGVRAVCGESPVRGPRKYEVPIDDAMHRNQNMKKPRL